ncbi:uncharacterized protein LOC118505095 isoform X2 [Anopheles stephensi]|uniref:uncharacterized protein LOC118505095 isoform X2 n=1 Tax=Anopheles stephensi TaxID=30069 RepID=UPI001658B154|nr:uncharacterized protein LOC118505095 isoform X2 [Anopheles stephensi]
MRMVSVPGTVVLLLVLLITLERGDAFLPIMNLYRDAGMACRWYNMPPYANAIASQGTNGGSVNYLTGLSTMLNRLYPDAFTGMGSQTRPRVVVRVEETDTLRNRNGIAVPAGTSGGNGNLILANMRTLLRIMTCLRRTYGEPATSFRRGTGQVSMRRRRPATLTRAMYAQLQHCSAS